MNATGRLAIGFRVGRFPSLTETFVLAHVEAMHARGHQVSVLAGTPPDSHAPPACAAKVGYVEPRDTPLSELFQKMPWRVRRAWTSAVERRWCAHHDVVLCHFGWAGASIATSVRGWRTRPPFAVVFHGDDLSRTLELNGPGIYRRLFEEADLLLPVSRLWASRLADLGAPRDKILVHRMGIDVDRFAMRTPLPAPSQRLRLVSVGRLVPKKGTAVTLKALRLLRDENPELAVTLDVLGGGPLLQELRDLADSLGLGDAVSFHGPQPREAVRGALSEADAFVLPSLTAPDGDMEGVPVAIMEAMAMGVPVVSTRHSGIPELVEHGRTGLLSKEGDVDGLARCLRILIDRPELVADMVQAARRKIEADYNNARLAHRLSDLLTTLAAARTSPVAGVPAAGVVRP